MLGVTVVLNWIKIKKHFTVVFMNFYINLLLSSILAGFFYFDLSLNYLIFLFFVSLLFFLYASKIKSILLLLYSIAYCYVGISGKILNWIDENYQREIEMGSLYFLISSLVIAYFLFKMRKSFAEGMK